MEQRNDNLRRSDNLRIFLKNKYQFLPTYYKEAYINLIIAEFAPILITGTFPENLDHRVIEVWTGYRGEGNLGNDDYQTVKDAFIQKCLPSLLQ